MSKVQVTLTSPIVNAADEESSRYSLMHVEIFPQPKDRVLAVSTNGRVAAIVELPGKTDRPRLIPCGVFPSTKAHMPRTGYPQIELEDGQWHLTGSKNGKVAPQAEAGRFPRLGDLVPALPSEENTLVVSFDAAELLKLADSIRSQAKDAGSASPEDGGCSPTVSLFIDKSRPEQNSAIAVVGTEGIGVLMPCWRDERQMSASAYIAEKRKRYTELAKRLQEAEAKLPRGFVQHYADEQPKPQVSVDPISSTR